MRPSNGDPINSSATSKKEMKMKRHMRTLTVVGRDNRAAVYEGVIIYTVKVPSLDKDTVLAALIKAREEDVGDLEHLKRAIFADIEILFCFEGELEPVKDWRYDDF